VSLLVTVRFEALFESASKPDNDTVIGQGAGQTAQTVCRCLMLAVWR